MFCQQRICSGAGGQDHAQHGFVLSLADDAALDPAATQIADGIDQQRFASPGFTGNDRHPVFKLH